MIEHTAVAETLPSSGATGKPEAQTPATPTVPSNDLTDGWVLEVGLAEFMGEQFEAFIEEALAAREEQATADIQTLPGAVWEIQESLQDDRDRISWRDLLQ